MGGKLSVNTKLKSVTGNSQSISQSSVKKGKMSNGTSVKANKTSISTSNLTIQDGPREFKVGKVFVHDDTSFSNVSTNDNRRVEGAFKGNKFIVTNKNFDSIQQEISRGNAQITESKRIIKIAEEVMECDKIIAQNKLDQKKLEDEEAELDRQIAAAEAEIAALEAQQKN